MANLWTMVPMRVWKISFCTFALLLISVCLPCFNIRFASAQSTAERFTLTNFTDSVIKCTGSSGLTPQNHTLPGAICLSPPDASNDLIAGRCFYNKTIAWHPELSFSTMFSFTTLELLQYREGEGFTFFIGPDEWFRNASGTTPLTGGYLGLVNSSIGGRTNGFFAVEFDLLTQSETKQFADPPYHHVGIDVNSLISEQTAKVKFNITSFNSIEKVYAWIEYDAPSKRVDVSLNTKKKRPCKTLLSMTLDDKFSTVLGNSSRRTVGFSSSTGGLRNADEPNSQTTIWDWAFSANGPVEDIYHGHEHCGIRKLSGRVIIIVALGGALVLTMPLLLILFLKARKVPQLKEENEALIQEKARILSGLSKMDFGAREFNYQELKEATEGFQHEIGRGGFGTVYKGELASGPVAVKQIKQTGTTEDAWQLVAEVQVIGRLRHLNIVPLLGWCYDKGNMMLVYKFMENADLDKHLFPSSPSEAGPLSWNKRVKILRGVAAALVFLHEEFETGEEVVHRDVKPNNVMLDGEFNAKLGDFGLSRLFSRSSSNRHSGPCAGTIGYLPPEFFMEITHKTDVYSFGVLAMVVATGRRPGDERIPQKDLVKWVRGLHDEDKLIDAVDDALTAHLSLGQRREMEAVLKVGLHCCAFAPSDRPTMRDVQHALPGLSAILTNLLPRQFPSPVTHKIDVDSDDSFVGGSSTSSRFGRSDTEYHSGEPFSTKIDVR